MTRYSYMILALLFTQAVNSQGPPTPAVQTLPTKPLIPEPKNLTDWSSQLIITDHFGRPFRPAYVDIIGSPFYFEDWKNAIATTGSGIMPGFRKIKIDLLNREIDYLGPDNDSMIVQDGLIKEFTLFDSSIIGNSYHFRSGYPEIDKHNSNTFYLILADGPLQLLKASRKEIVINKNDISGETSKEFVLYEDFYVYRDGNFSRLKKDRNFVLGFMENHRQKIEEYLKNNKLNFKNINSIAELFKYYNSQLRAF